MADDREYLALCARCRAPLGIMLVLARGVTDRRRSLRCADHSEASRYLIPLFDAASPGRRP